MQEFMVKVMVIQDLLQFQDFVTLIPFRHLQETLSLFLIGVLAHMIVKYLGILQITMEI